MYFRPHRHSFQRPPGLQTGRSERCPLVIVGAGPVGLTLALALARQGEQAVVLEEDDSVGGGSRALGMSQRTLEIWEALGAAQPILASGLPWSGGRTFYRGKMVLEFEMPQDPALKHPPMLNIQQCFADQYLLDALAQEPAVQLRWLNRMKSLRIAGDKPIVTVETPEGPYEIEADFVVGCDGPRSAVRAALGAHMVGATFEARYVIVDIFLRSTCPPGRRAWFDPPSNPGSTVIMHRQPDDLWRLDYQLRDDEDLEAALDERAIRERVQRHLDFIGERGEWRIEWSSWYKAHSRSLPQFRYGPVLFAGDAAHLIPIFGIRGLNSGVEDAWTLAWKLAYVRQGKADEQLLESYSVERVAAAQENIAQANRSTCIMTPPTGGLRLMRDAVLSLALTEPSVRGILNPRQGTPASARNSALNSHAGRSAEFAGGPQPGDIAPNIVVKTAAGARRLHEVLDLRRFSALRFDDGRSTEAESLAFEPELNWVHVDGHSARERFAAEPGSCYLIRPDHLVCARWRAFHPHELRDALSQARSRAAVH